MSNEFHLIFDLGENIKIYPRPFSNNSLIAPPSDLARFAPYGNSTYGFQGQGAINPFLAAPSTSPCGGVIYFDNNICESDFYALMSILQIQRKQNIPNKKFAVFADESSQPAKDNYLAQVRCITNFGLRFAYNAITADQYDTFTEQQLTIAETYWTFIKHERKRWGTSFCDNSKLNGKFGGDDDFECEQLSFGFMLENEYYGISRIWSRAWLVTK